MLIENRTFLLADGVSEADFLDADRRVQEEVAPFQEGFVRRTTARGDGDWIVVTLWSGAADADTAAAATADHPARRAFAAAIDPASVELRRYETLD